MSWNAILGGIMIFSGILTMVVGIYAMCKYNNFYTRLSCSSLIDTAGFILVMGGLIFYVGFSYAALKIGFIVFLMVLLNPLASHILGRSAYMSNYHP